MALDEAIAISVREDNVPPTLRIYGWILPSVSVGCFQRIGDIDTDYCSKNHITVVRRPTGGRGIFHGSDITYSFSARTVSGPFSKGLLDSYKQISSALGLALIKTGLSPELKLVRKARRAAPAADHGRDPFCFRAMSFGEIAINGKKIVGSAQKRWTDGLLQQGSIPFVVNGNEIIRIFRLSTFEEIRNSMTALREIAPSLDYEKFKDAVRISFEETFHVNFIFSSPSEVELSLASELEAQKYLSSEWNFKR